MILANPGFPASFLVPEAPLVKILYETKQYDPDTHKMVLSQRFSVKASGEVAITIQGCDPDNKKPVQIIHADPQLVRDLFAALTACVFGEKSSVCHGEDDVKRSVIFYYEDGTSLKADGVYRCGQNESSDLLVKFLKIAQNCE